MFLVWGGLSGRSSSMVDSKFSCTGSWPLNRSSLLSEGFDGLASFSFLTLRTASVSYDIVVLSSVFISSFLNLSISSYTICNAFLLRLLIALDMILISFQVSLCGIVSSNSGDWGRVFFQSANSLVAYAFTVSGWPYSQTLLVFCFWLFTYAAS